MFYQTSQILLLLNSAANASLLNGHFVVFVSEKRKHIWTSCSRTGQHSAHTDGTLGASVLLCVNIGYLCLHRV